MIQVVVTPDQAKLLSEAQECVEVVDVHGKRLGTVVRPPSDEDVRIAKERLKGNAKRYTTQEVVEHLRSLERS